MGLVYDVRHLFVTDIEGDNEVVKVANYVVETMAADGESLIADSHFINLRNNCFHFPNSEFMFVTTIK